MTLFQMVLKVFPFKKKSFCCIEVVCSPANGVLNSEDVHFSFKTFSLNGLGICFLLELHWFIEKGIKYLFQFLNFANHKVKLTTSTVHLMV